MLPAPLGEPPAAASSAARAPAGRVPAQQRRHPVLGAVPAVKPVTVGREERGGGGGVQTCEQLRVVAVVTVEGAGALDFQRRLTATQRRCRR